MANPYHNGEGRFCSKGEMTAAVEELGKKGDLEGYFKLRSEYEAIESGKLQISSNLINTITRSGLNIFDNRVVDPDDIREIYKGFASEIATKKEGSFYNIISMVNNPATPTDIREEILANASPEVKYAIAEKGIEDRSNMLGADLQKIVAGESDENLISLVMRTRKLTFEDKYNISKQSETGLARFAEYNSKNFFATPELEKELRDKAASFDDNDGNRDAYIDAMSRFSRQEDSHNFVIDNAVQPIKRYGDVDGLRQLAGNPNISPKTGLKLATHYAEKNIVDWQETCYALATNRDGKAGNVFARALSATDRTTLSPIKAPAPEELKAEYARLNALKDESLNRDLTYAEEIDITTVEARYNAYEENSKDLLHRGKLLSKRNAPAVNELGESKKVVVRKYQYASSVLHANAYVNHLKAMITDPR